LTELFSYDQKQKRTNASIRHSHPHNITNNFIMGKKSGGIRVKQVMPKMPNIPSNFNPMEEMMQTMQQGIGGGMMDEMMRLPPPVNRKYQVFWPIHESFTMKIDKFQVIYPSYLDSNKTIKLGRRISSELAVPMPTVSDVSQALQLLGVRHVIQPYKGYSPDPTCLWDNPGRCLVDVSTVNKKQLLLLIAQRIRNDELPDRRVRLQREEDVRTKEQLERVAAATAEAAAKVAASNRLSNTSSSGSAGANSNGAGGGTGGGGGGNKKKAKGKRK
jgi:signal recognition particle subunit SRP19